MISLSNGIYFVSGIDTGIGKSVATGILAREALKNGKLVITQKLVQTGCSTVSEDILTHRRIMGFPLQEVDYAGLTCPYIFKHPSSPHLAARLENKSIDPEIITAATEKLSNRYDIVLIEGAGGLMVPIGESLLIIDYIKQNNYPLLLVTSPRLGSINQTLLNLELCRQRNINLTGVIYNLFPQTDPIIVDDTRRYIKQYLPRINPAIEFIEIPVMGDSN